MLEFGMRKGLAVRLPDESQQIAYRGMRANQAKIQAENKAKMFADDMDFMNVMNSHDNPLVKEYATKQIMQMGSFLRNNPDWETNPLARAEYNKMRHELKDNPDLNRGMQSDANYQTWQKYIADPKNADMRDDPEIQKVSQQWNNYLKFGNQYATNQEEVGKLGGKKEFTFMAPEDLVDTTAKLIELAKATQFDDFKNFGYQNSGLRSSITSSRKDLAVQHGIASTWGKYLKKDYDKYVSQLQGNEKTNAKTLNQFVKERMDPYFPSEKIEKAYEAPVIKPPSGGSGADARMTNSLWLSMHDKALNTPGQRIDFGAEAVQYTFANKLGEHNLDGVKDPFGNVLNLGLRGAQSTGLVQPQRGPDGTVYSEYDALVRLPLTEFKQLGNKFDDVIDDFWWDQITAGASDASVDWEIEPEYEALGFKKYTDDKGRALVEFPVKQKYDPLNVHLSDNYSNAHNVSPHKEDPYKGIEGSGEVVISDDGKWQWDGAKWIARK